MIRMFLRRSLLPVLAILAIAPSFQTSAEGADPAIPKTPIIPTVEITPPPTPTPTKSPTPTPTATPYVPTAAQVRSTFYDGSNAAQVQYTHQSRFDTGTVITIEAWVYHQGTDGCQTIVSHDRSVSYWFGLCPRPRFSWGGGDFAEAAVAVPARQWTHVAVNYAGGIARFFVDGELAGGDSDLIYGDAGVDRPLALGADPSGFHLRGYLDEVRIWSTLRSEAEIRNGMFEEIRTGSGLNAVFPDGGDQEALSNATGTSGGGAQESVFGILPRDLVVPRAAIPPQVDGQVDPAVEYLGAEQLVIRYDEETIPPASDSDSGWDAVAYLVHTETDLYIGLSGIRLPHTVEGGSSTETSWVGLFLDPLFSRTPLAQGGHVLARALLERDQHVGEPSDQKVAWRVGDGAGGYAPCAQVDPGQCPILGEDWTVSKGVPGEFARTEYIEFRISKDLLGEWTEADGLAIGHFDLTPDGDRSLGPGDATWNAPATWAQVTYSDGSAALPQAHIRGHVYNAFSEGPRPPFPNYEVRLTDAGSHTTLYTTTTRTDGSFEFDVPVPGNRAFYLSAPLCDSLCERSDPEASASGMQPIRIDFGDVLFPGCPAEEDDCTYASVDFFIREPIGPMALARTDPVQPTAHLIVRQNLLLTSAGGDPPPQVTLHGQNLHGLLEFYLSPNTGVDDHEAWVLYPAEVVARTPDETRVTLAMPALPKRTKIIQNSQPAASLSREWRWVIKDPWIRQGASIWNTSDSFRLTPPPYPLLSGFGFENRDDRATLEDFLAVYGDNAYICIGVFGLCATHVPDPLYWIVWEPIYTALVNSSGGSCVGLSATSLLMRHGDLQPEQVDPDVFYPAGFTDQYAFNARFEYDGIGGPITGPPQPVNLWAMVRMNHGVQFSSEFIHEILADSVGDGAFTGDPMTQYDELQGRVDDYVISMVPSFGKGHAVAPYAIQGNQVYVYDNNDPRDPNRAIEFDAASNDYIFPRTDGETWRGNAIYTIPLDIWRQERTAPIIDLKNLFQGTYTLIFGAADGHYTTAGGGEWGWRADGTFVDDMPGARAIPPLGPALTDTHNVPLIMPMAAFAPTIDVNTRGGGDYTYHASQGGTILQLDVFTATAGVTDQIALEYQGEALRAFRFTPATATGELVPKVGMAPDERQRLLFRWGGLAVDGGGSVGFEALPDAHGAVFTNDSGAAARTRLVVDSVDGAAEAHGTRAFGPFSVPENAVQRVTVADWPQSEQLRVELDLDGDGTFDQTTVVTGEACASEDADGNGLPDACEEVVANGASLFLPAVWR